jgi:nucleoside-diphosphate-sugar epimerase
MARALIVGCGGRGRALGSRLLEEGWAVRGTSRTQAGVREIDATGIDGALADPDLVGTVLDHVADVTVLVWLMGSADGSREELVAVNQERLGSLLEKLVDTPVRGFVLEAEGSVPREVLDQAIALTEDAAARWSIPVSVVRADPAAREKWTDAMARAVPGVLGT